MDFSMYLLIIVAVVAANLPFFSGRLLCVFPLRKKHFGHHLFEWVVFFCAVGLFAYLLEARLRTPQEQGWKFYVITLCLFAVCAFPGFVYRYFYRRG